MYANNSDRYVLWYLNTNDHPAYQGGVGIDSAVYNDEDAAESALMKHPDWQALTIIPFKM